MYTDKDGWPMPSWYDYVHAWFQNAMVTLGWRIINFGRWVVCTFHPGGGASGCVPGAPDIHSDTTWSNGTVTTGITYSYPAALEAAELHP